MVSMETKQPTQYKVSGTGWLCALAYTHSGIGVSIPLIKLTDQQLRDIRQFEQDSK